MVKKSKVIEKNEEETTLVTRPKDVMSDSRVKSLLTDMRGGSLALDVDAHLNEMEAIHASRLVRRLQADAVFGNHSLKTIGEAMLQNQANRSRVVEIQVLALRRRMLVEKRLKRTRDYVLSAYGRSFKGTVQDKNAMMSRIFDPALELIADFERIEEYASVILEDIDQARWVLQGLRASIDAEQREFR